MAAGGHTLGTIRGTIEIDYDGAGIVRAIRDTEKTKKSMGGLGGASDKVLGAFGKFAGGATKVAGAVNLANNAVSIIAGTIAAVGPIAAAAFATAPGVILGFVAVVGVMKIALAGVGDALKAAGGDSKKFEAAIKGLSPEAQKFAKSFRAAYPALVQVKNAIQDAFFKGTAGQIGGVVSRIASLKPQAAGVASALGKVVQNIVKTATSSGNIDKLRVVLSGVTAFLLRIRTAIGPVVTGFLNLAAQAGQFGGTLGGSVANGLAKLAGFLQSIDLKSLFATAMPIIQQFGALFKTIGSIVSSVFGGISVDGASAVGVLGALATQLAAFLKSAQGQAALAALGTAMQAISGAAGQVFLALLQAIAPVLVALAPGVTVLAGQISGLLVPAISALAPVLLAVANFLSQNMTWLGPLAGAVVAAAAAYKVYAAAATAVSAVQSALNSKIVTNTGAWIGNAAAAVAAKVQMLALRAVVGAQMVAAWAANTAAIIANKAAQIASNIASGAQAVAAWAANTVAVIANRVALIAGQAAMLLVRGATIAWTAVQWLLNAALSANPIGLVVIAIAALVAGLIYAYNHSAAFRAIVQATWAAIKTAISVVVNWITGTVWPSLQRAWQQISNGAVSLWHMIVSAFNSIKSGITTAINAVRAVISAVWSAIVSLVRGYINVYRSVIMAGFNAAKAVINSVMNAAKAVVSAVWRAIVSVVRSNISAVKSAIAGISSVVTTIRNAFNRGKSAVQSAISGILSLVRSLPGRVSGALGGLGSLLYSKGKSLVQGFINGIASMIGAVASKAKSVVSAVTKYLPGSPAKTGPLSGKGYVRYRAQRFMTDFAKGMNDGSHKPVAALMGAVGPVARAVAPSSSTGRSGGSTAAAGATLSAAGDRIYRVALGEKEFAELVVDAVTGKPKAVAKAAAEGARRSAWAGSGRH